MNSNPQYCIYSGSAHLDLAMQPLHMQNRAGK